MVYTRKFLGIILTALIASVLIFFLLDLFIYFFIPNPKDFDVKPGREVFDYRPGVLYANKPGLDVKVVKYFRNSKILEYEVITDELGRRIDPDLDSSGKHQHLALFGDSLTFGEGLEAGQTLSSQLSRELPAYMLSNFGVNGYGPNHVLALTSEPKIVEELRSYDGGVIIYTVLLTPPTGHLERTSSSPFIFDGWKKYIPGVAEVDGQIVLSGKNLLDSARSYYPKFLDGLQRWRIFYVMPFLSEIVSSLITSQQQYDLMCRVIHQIGKGLHEKVPEYDFVAAFHPFSSRDQVRRTEKCLVESAYLNAVIPFEPFEGKDYHIPMDGHATGLANERLSKYMAEYLRKRNLIY